jgi:hypothetical protein
MRLGSCMHVEIMMRAAQVAASTLLGAYSSASEGGVRTAIQQTGAAWVLSQPAAALVTWLRHTALPVSTAPSPVVAVAVLGVLVSWRASYTTVRRQKCLARRESSSSSSHLISLSKPFNRGDAVCRVLLEPAYVHRRRRRQPRPPRSFCSSRRK